MLNLSDESVHFGRRDCSTSAAEGVQLERYIHSATAEQSAASCEELSAQAQILKEQIDLLKI